MLEPSTGVCYLSGVSNKTSLQEILQTAVSQLNYILFLRLYAGKTHSINHWRKPKPTRLGCWILLKESASGSAPDYRASKRNSHSGDVTLVKLHTPVASYSCQFPLPCLNLSVHSPIHLVINQSTRHAVIQPVTQPVSHSTTQPINQTSQSLNQSLTQPINHSTNQSF